MTFIRELAILVLLGFAIQTLGRETRKIVAVVDTGLPKDEAAKPYLCEKQYDITGYGVEDRHGHGTNVVGLIAKTLNPKTHCITMIKWYHSNFEYNNDKTHLSRTAKYMQILKKLNPVIVNMSLEGAGYDAVEYEGIKALLKSGSKVIVAAGNDGMNLSESCTVYPACYALNNKNYHVVGSMDFFRSNYRGPITNIMPGANQCGIFGYCLTGTSQATANYTASLLKESN